MKNKRTPRLEPARKVLPRSIEELGPAFAQQYLCNYTLSHWKDIAGDAIAQNVEAVRIVKKTLWLYTYDASWRSQIALMSRTILQHVNNFAGQALVSEIRFAKSGRERRALAALPENGGIDYRHLLPKVNLTKEEMAAVREKCAAIEDEGLRGTLFRLGLKQAKREHLHQELGYHPCKDCGILCPPERLRCSICEGKHQEALRRAIRSILEETPWVRFYEVKKELPEATPELLASVRASYVQYLASKVLLLEPDTLQAKTLTMAFCCIPPELITEDRVRRTLYRLRGDLAKPAEWKPVRRYDYLHWGKGKKWKDTSKREEAEGATRTTEATEATEESKG